MVGAPAPPLLPPPATPPANRIRPNNTASSFVCLLLLLSTVFTVERAIRRPQLRERARAHVTRPSHTIYNSSQMLIIRAHTHTHMLEIVNDVCARKRIGGRTPHFDNCVAAAGVVVAVAVVVVGKTWAASKTRTRQFMLHITWCSSRHSSSSYTTGDVAHCLCRGSVRKRQAMNRG